MRNSRIQLSIFLLSLVTIPILCKGQTENLFVTGPGEVARINYAKFTFYRAEQIEYSDIRGNCFYNKEWNPAMLRINKDWVKAPKAKLNLYTNEVSLVDEQGKELVVQKWAIDQIVFYDRADTV